MNPGTVLHGFELKQIIPVKELEAELYWFVHQKTGAELIWSKRDDTNKSFSVTFETLPENDTGVFHILEHSVLCGSEKYPVREPFVELLKSSLNTFLNAITSPDKTMYPVSSRNDADFRNLISVYLDAVFKPAIYDKESIFMQEGWRCELDAETGKPHYIGVVFNEMKGAMSSVDEVIYTEMYRMLFPDNCYGYVSGGDPVSIPNLTYEEFINNHRRFYHPSNARFFLDGNVPLDAVLSDINGYLCHYDRREPDFELNMQTPVAGECRTVQYEVGPGEDEGDKAHFALSKIAATWQDYAKITAANVLCDYLAGSNDAPLKREVLQQGLAQDMNLQVYDGTAQPTINLQLRNVNPEKLDGLRATLRGLLEKISAAGLDHDELTACLNRYEFRAREHHEPYGLILNVTMLQSWLYGGDPTLYLRQNEMFAAVRRMLEDGSFEALMQELLLDERGMCELHLLPSTALGEEKLNAELDHASNLYAALNDDEKSTLAAKLDALHQWQQTPDTEEQLATLPHLELSDVSDDPQWTDLTVEEVDGVRVLRSPVNASGMVYLKLYFPLGQVSTDELAAAKVLARLLGELPTKQHSVQELQREIKTHIGSLTHDVEAYTVTDAADNACVPCFVVNCSVLESKVDDAIRLIREVQLDTVLDKKDKIRDLLQQAEIHMQQTLVMSGNAVGMTRVLSGFRAESLVKEHVSGYSAYAYLKGLNRTFDEKIGALIDTMTAISRKAFVRAGMTIGVTGHISTEQLAALAQAFPIGEKTDITAVYSLQGKKAEGIAIPAGISFAEIGITMQQLGAHFTGAWCVLSKLVSLVYLWNEVRVQGGAYGCGLLIRATGEVAFYSYRDPNAARSLGVYRNAPAFVRSFCESGAALDSIIIGTISDTEPLMSPKQQSEMAFTRYLCGVTLEAKRQERREILQTKPEDLLALCNLLDAVAENASVCVVGSESILAQCEGLEKL